MVRMPNETPGVEPAAPVMQKKDYSAFYLPGAIILAGLLIAVGLFFGLVFSLGSTAVVLPILTTRDEMGSPFARRFLAVSIFQDLAVIPLMLLVPAFAAGATGGAKFGVVMIRVGIAIVGVVLLVIAARVAVPRLFAAIARLGSREAFTAAAIVLIVATIAAADRIGISAALGAFAAGVVVGDTDFIHQVESILRPFRDFLSALFFTSVGMLLNPSFVIRHPLAVLGARRHGLLDQHVDAAPERLDRTVGVRRGRRRERDEVDLVEECCERLEGGDPEILLRAGARGWIRIVPAHERDALDPLPGAGMVASEVPEPRNPDPHLGHRTMPRSELRTNSTNSWTSG